MSLTFDVTGRTAVVTAALDDAAAWAGSVDIVVNNAGGAHRAGASPIRRAFVPDDVTEPAPNKTHPPGSHGAVRVPEW